MIIKNIALFYLMMMSFTSYSQLYIGLDNGLQEVVTSPSDFIMTNSFVYSNLEYRYLKYRFGIYGQNNYFVHTINGKTYVDDYNDIGFYIGYNLIQGEMVALDLYIGGFRRDYDYIYINIPNYYKGRGKGLIVRSIVEHEIVDGLYLGLGFTALRDFNKGDLSKIQYLYFFTFKADVFKAFRKIRNK